MSQVIVPQDALAERRQRTRQQERQIDIESRYAKWRLSDVTKPNPILKVIGIATLPVVAFWGLLTVVLGFGLFVMGAVMKILMTFFGGTKK